MKRFKNWNGRPWNQKCPAGAPHSSSSRNDFSNQNICRKRAESWLRDMFVRRTLLGMEKPMEEWAIDPILNDYYDKGPSAWCNMHNRVKKEMCGVQCK